ncbi:hypothetical protein ACHAXT_012739 [Thalassiosira profunda]
MAAEGVLLSLAAAASFWVQSVVTEERLVPALHLVADRHNIPDDVAGATLMAAGASSPELLCTLVSLFVTRSSLGLGTIVGSEIFNQLVICAGSVYASRSRRLVLDRRMVVRETAFYGLSLGLLAVALGERRAYEGDEEEERVYVSFGKACLLVGGYVLYVIVCANTEAVEACLRRIGGRGDSNCEGGESDAADDLGAERHIEACPSHGSVRYKSFDDDDLHELPFIHNVTTEPVENRETAATANEDEIVIANSSLSREGGESIAVDDANGDAQHRPRRRGLLSTAARRLLCRAESYPVEAHDVYELTSDDGGHQMGCFLWQRSYFYTQAYFGSHAFHLRWFSMTPQRVASVPDRNEPDKHVLVYPLFDEIHVDERRLIVYIVHPEEGRRDFTLMAPSRAIFDAVVTALEEYMRATVELRQQGLTELDESQHRGEDATTATKRTRKRDADADPHVDLIEVPRNASHAELALWASVYPLRLVMHMTLPDVRRLDRHGQPAKSAAHAYLATVACLGWLIAGS